MGFDVCGISVELGTRRITNEEILDEGYAPRRWTSISVEEKTGFSARQICADSEDCEVLASRSLDKLLQKMNIQDAAIDGLIVCSQTAASLPGLSFRLAGSRSFSERALLLDLSYGCAALPCVFELCDNIMNGRSGLNTCLIVFVDTYSRYLAKQDFSSRSLFGDGACAFLVKKTRVKRDEFNLRYLGSSCVNFPAMWKSISMNDGQISMKGPEVMAFILDRVVDFIEGIKKEAIDKEGNVIIPHQANKYILMEIQQSLTRRGVDIELPFLAKDYGNLACSSLGVSLAEYLDNAEHSPCTINCIGFGVGLSISSASFRIPSSRLETRVFL